MASVRIIRAAMDRGTADPAHEELSKFIQIHSLGIVQKEQEKTFYFDAQLERKTPELRIASGVVDDFLSLCSLSHESFNLVLPALTGGALEHRQETCGRFSRSLARQREVHKVDCDLILLPTSRTNLLGQRESHYISCFR
jgi:hypothetical protein